MTASCACVALRLSVLLSVVFMISLGLHVGQNANER